MFPHVSPMAIVVPRHGASPPAANMSPAFEVPGCPGAVVSNGWSNMERYWW